MDPNVFEGVWEDVARKHANALKGQRVEVRLLDHVKPKTTPNAADVWTAFEAVVSKLTRGKRIPSGKLLVAEDFYESHG